MPDTIVSSDNQSSLSIVIGCLIPLLRPTWGVGQNGQISFRKTGKEDCGYMACGSKIFFVPSEKYEPNIQPTL